MKRAAMMLALAATLLSLAPVAHGEELELVRLLGDLGATCEWSPLRGAGVVLAGDERVAFALGVPFVLVNWRERVVIEAPTRRDDGSVWTTSEAVASVRAAIQRQREERASRTQRIAVVLLDPGHGGKDSGAVGDYLREGRTETLLEKDVNREIAAQLGKLLRSGMPDKEIVFTRADDVTVALEERPKIANRLLEQTGDAVLYVSIHSNASLNRKANGFEVWYLPPTFRRTLLDEGAAAADDREILPILNSMLEEEISVESILLGRDILRGLDGTIGRASPNRGLKEEAWAVVRNSKMPAVLVEVGYVTNPEEASRLADSAYLQDIAEGLYHGIMTFVARYERAGGPGG